MRNKLNIKLMFLEKPNRLSERIILFILLTITFMIFFNPLRFSPISPLEALFISMLPSLSISWGIVVLFRLVYRKSDYIDKRNE